MGAQTKHTNSFPVLPGGDRTKRHPEMHGFIHDAINLEQNGCELLVPCMNKGRGSDASNSCTWDVCLV